MMFLSQIAKARITLQQLEEMNEESRRDNQRYEYPPLDHPNGI